VPFEKWARCGRREEIFRAASDHPSFFTIRLCPPSLPKSAALSTLGSMSSHPIRYYESGDLHFITCSWRVAHFFGSNLESLFWHLPTQ
jgi:hypothetical protein